MVGGWCGMTPQGSLSCADAPGADQARGLYLITRLWQGGQLSGGELIRRYGANDTDRQTPLPIR